MIKNPLMDKNFLYKLDQCQQKEIYARIIALTFDERPLETIEGRVTQGSINIDGTSAVRRTCSLTLIAKDVNVTDFYWGVSNKFTLEVGVKNFINPDYPDIIWFKQGVYVISSFNSSLTQNNYTISIGGKDKMCLLNGDVGGNLPASIDFGTIDEYKDTYTKVTIENFSQYEANKYYIVKDTEFVPATEKFDSEEIYYTKDTLVERTPLPLKDIILEAVHTYGKEAYHNIIINDLDECGLEILQYRGDRDLYLLYNEDEAIYDQLTVNGDFIVGKKIKEDGSLEANGTKVSEIDTNGYNAAIKVDPTFEDARYKFKTDLGTTYSVTRVSYTDPQFNASAVGYRVTDLTYAGDLISSIGESLTSILDKIKNMLGAFEYFYDVNGKFVFQAKKIYSKNSWNSLISTDGNVFARDAIETSPYSYSFEDVNLIQKFTNTPSINTVKNDYAVWGVRKTATGAEIPIHSRYAIHEKPIYYKNFDGEVFTTFDIEDIIPTANKDLLPECLKSGFEYDWWDIAEWAELYKAMTGEYPQDRIGTYAKYTCKLDLNKYFPPGVIWNKNQPLFLFDVAANGDLYYAGHNPWSDGVSPSQSCTHSYSYFLDNAAQRGIKAYIYAPTIPSTVKVLYHKVDWREIIYQMALDYYQHGQEATFLRQLAINNIKDNGDSYYPSGETGYEAFYVDMQGFWRQLYDTNPEKIYDTEGGKYDECKFYRVIFSEDNGSQEFSAKKDYLYTPDDKKEIFSPVQSNSYDLEKEYYTLNKELGEESFRIGYKWTEFKKLKTFSCDYYLPEDPDDTLEENKDNYSKEYFYWNKNVIQSPQLLNFWIDFYNGDDSLQQYKIAHIGNRSKVVNNDKISSLYYREVPQVIFIKDKNEYDHSQMKSGYTYIYLSKEMTDLFAISARGKSAEEEIVDLFNKHSYCSETVQITTIPIYHLEPNTLIHIRNDENGINGKYEVSKFTIPLSYSGMMSINASKIIDVI